MCNVKRNPPFGWYVAFARRFELLEPLPSHLPPTLFRFFLHFADDILSPWKIPYLELVCHKIHVEHDYIGNEADENSGNDERYFGSLVLDIWDCPESLIYPFTCQRRRKKVETREALTAQKASGR